MKLFAAATVLLTVLTGCQRSSTESVVTFVDRSEVYSNADLSERTDSLLLVVEIAEDSKLTLNKIDVGTTADLDRISEKLETIFEDRARAAIAKREVVIEMNGNVSGKHFERLIERLIKTNATPIRVIKGSL